MRSVVSVPGLCNRNCAHAEPFALGLNAVEGHIATSQDHSANPEREPLTTHPEVGPDPWHLDPVPPGPHGLVDF